MRMQATTFLLALAMVAMPSTQAKYDGAYLKNLTGRLLTPHLTWATPNARKIKVLFVVSRDVAAREVVELQQRMEMEWTAFVCVSNTILAVEDAYEGSLEGTTIAEKSQEVIDKLSARYDVIVLGNTRFEILPLEARYRLLKQVMQGTGLVFFYHNDPNESRIFSQPDPDGRRIILDLVGWAGQPQLLQEQKDQSVVKTYRLGQGNVALLDYPGRHGTIDGGLSLTVQEPYSSNRMARYENNLVLAAKAILWAAGKPPKVTIKNETFSQGASFSQDTIADTVVKWIVTGLKRESGTLEVRLRDQQNRVLRHQKQGVTGDSAAFSFRLPFLTAGTYFLDAMVATAHGVENFGYHCFQVTSPVGEMEMTTDKPSYQKGEPTLAHVSLKTPLPQEARLHVRLEDCPFGRVWKTQTVKVSPGQKKINLTLPVREFPTLAGRLVVEIVSSKGVLATEEKNVFFPDQDREIFPVIVWGNVSPYLPEVTADQINEAGFTACLVSPNPGGENVRLNALFNLKSIPYIYRVSLAPDEKGWTWDEWVKNEEKQLTEGSIYNPDALAVARKIVHRRMQNLACYGPLVYSLGDENSYSYEGGYSPTEQGAFIRYLKGKYGTIDNLNRQWVTAFANFDRVRHYTPRELRTQKNYAAWNDHREFMEKGYADWHRYLSRCIKEVDPNARVGAEGSIPGNMEETIHGLEFWGPYLNTVGNELLRSLGADKLRTNWWGGYVAERDDPLMKFWGLLLKGTNNGCSMFAMSPGSLGFLSCDLSYADYFAAMVPELKRSFQGLAPLLSTTPMQQAKVAILWSHTSASAATMNECFLNPDDGAEALINFCYQTGIGFDLLTSRMIENSRLDKYRILFLPGASALSDREVAAIEGFARTGGMVVADMNPGVLNEYCRHLGKSQLAELFAAPEMTGNKKFVLAPIRVDRQVTGKRVTITADQILTSEESDPFKVNTYGKGQAVLLNFGLGALKVAAAPGTFEPFLLALLGLNGVKPEVTVEGVSSEGRVIRIREGSDFKLLGLLTKRGDVGKPLTVTLSETSFVYRADGGLIGHLSHWTQKIDRPLMVFALFKEKTVPPQIGDHFKSLRPGQNLTLPVTVTGKNRMIRLELTDPTGRPVATYPKVLGFEDGQKTLSVPFAYNDNPGLYHIKITDVACGLSTDVTLNLQPNE